MRFGLTLAILLLASPACAQPADGLYEDFPSIFMAPSGPLAAPPSTLPRWVDVRTHGHVTRVTFEPDARIVWEIAWGPHGPIEKITRVNGHEWTRSQFTYDANGDLATKTVTGIGAPGGLTYQYEVDPSTHAIRARTTTITGGLAPGPERVEVTRTAQAITVRTTRAGAVVRRDRYDAQQRLIETRLYRNGIEVGRLTYRRDALGALQSIRRRIGRHRGVADPTRPDTTLESMDVHGLAYTPIERHEALLLLGAATHMNDEGRGAHRRLTLDFAPDACWLNATSGLVFDDADVLVDGSTGCICGFCVDASAVAADELARALSRQEHWSRGPWVRIDDAVDVTIDHALATPIGNRRAGDLAPGDLVLDADGAPHAVLSIELLADASARRGVNLVTPEGTFAAGGLRFVSETARACAP